MPAFSVALERIVRRPVNDKTGLQGAFDFDLTYTPDALDAPGRDWRRSAAPSAVQSRRPPAQQGGPSLFEALRNQLGLRLEGGRAPVDVLVVDQVQQPTEN